MTELARYVVFGEALTDFIREGPGRWRSAAGGSPWNVARVGARLGLATGFAGAVSTDVLGEEILRLSREAGLDPRFVQQVERAPLLALVVSKHPPQYFFIGENSADLHFDPGELPEGWIATAEVVHFGSLSLAREPLAGRLLVVAEKVRADGRRIAFDPNYRNLMGEAYRPTLRRMTELADYIKVSDEDLEGLFPAIDPVAALGQLRAWSPRASFLFTHGGAGLELVTPERRVVQPAFPVRVEDTVGAGDASMAGWMFSVITRPEARLEDHAAFAAGAAAVACEHVGAYAPTFAEVSGFLGGRGVRQPT
ncbi:MAG: carbohydrate kinase [Deltaproteobacteria bacterium]|nr:MAG: carbohydrate kinase [Deltaproteobacteria bacterium]